METITWDEVKKHKSAESCWLVIHGGVYDVTSFLPEHPGGTEILLDNAANPEASEKFEDIGHSRDARTKAQSLLIGKIEGADSYKMLEEGEYMSREKRKEQGQQQKGGSGSDDTMTWIGTAAALAAVAGIAYMALR